MSIRIVINFLEKTYLTSHITKYATTVAIAAPIAPITGIKAIFNIVLTTAEIIVVVAIALVFLAALKILP